MMNQPPTLVFEIRCRFQKALEMADSSNTHSAEVIEAQKQMGTGALGRRTPIHARPVCCRNARSHTQARPPSAAIYEDFKANDQAKVAATFNAAKLVIDTYKAEITAKNAQVIALDA